jgi:hypothetical protein
LVAKIMVWVKIDSCLGLVGTNYGIPEGRALRIPRVN